MVFGVLKGRRLLAIDGCLIWKCIRRLLENPFILVSMSFVSIIRFKHCVLILE
jgi:uncharacterized metal-binding protein